MPPSKSKKRKVSPSTKTQKKTVIKVLKQTLTEMYGGIGWNTDAFDDIEDDEDIDYLNGLIKIALMYDTDSRTANALQHIYIGINDGDIDLTRFLDFLDEDSYVQNLRLR